MKWKYILFYVVLSQCLESVAQDWKGISKTDFQQKMKATSESALKENQKISFERSIYKEISNKEPDAKDQGVFYHGIGNQYRSESGGQTTIQSGNLKIVIDTVQKMILISKSDSLFEQMDISKRILPFMEQVDTIFKKEDAVIQYQAQFNNQNSYFSGMEFSIHPKSGQLYKLIIYYRPSNYFSESMDDETIEVPKIEMKYKDYSKLTGKEKLFTTEKWLISEKDGTFILTPSFNHFELIDTRIEK